MKEPDINDWIDAIKDDKKPKIPDGNIKTIINDIVFDIKWNLNHYITSPIKNIIRGFENLIKYRSLIWNDRWWDYSFFLNMMLFKLKDMENRWGTDTHYVGDLEDKETLKKLIHDLEWMIDDDNELLPDYTEQYKKRSRSFFGRLDRNHLKLWD